MCDILHVITVYGSIYDVLIQPFGCKILIKDCNILYVFNTKLWLLCDGPATGSAASITSFVVSEAYNKHQT